jgi:hypothetical protein
LGRERVFFGDHAFYLRTLPGTNVRQKNNANSYAVRNSQSGRRLYDVLNLWQGLEIFWNSGADPHGLASETARRLATAANAPGVARDAKPDPGPIDLAVFLGGEG